MRVWGAAQKPNKEKAKTALKGIQFTCYEKNRTTAEVRVRTQPKNGVGYKEDAFRLLLF